MSLTEKRKYTTNYLKQKRCTSFIDDFFSLLILLKVDCLSVQLVFDRKSMFPRMTIINDILQINDNCNYLHKIDAYKVKRMCLFSNNFMEK